MRIAAALLLCAATAFAAPRESALRTELSGFAAPVFSPDGSFTNTVTAFGKTPRVGSFFLTTIETSQVNWDGSWTITGTFTMDTKKEDTITGTSVSLAGLDSTGFVTSEGRYTITGGTGRYAGATGTGAITGRWRAEPPFEFDGSMTGTLSNR
jgi:hypothetical protein